MSNYQRGTDLKHCPDGCSYLQVDDQYEFSAVIDCLATDNNYPEFGLGTCPREQAETSGYISIVGEPCDSSGTLTVTPKYGSHYLDSRGILTANSSPEKPEVTWDNPQACWSCEVDSVTCEIKGRRDPSNSYCPAWKERPNE